MANLQPQMKSFHEDIRLGGFEENQDLRDKKEILLKALRNNINNDENEPELKFSPFDQGSYAMHTGVKPLHKADDYDIDVGIIFDLDGEEHEKYRNDPVALKKRIKKTLDVPQRTVNIRRPCVTVQYVKDGVNQYHVDMAIYQKSAYNADHLDLARGKEGSVPENRFWEENNPKGLISEINGRFPGDPKKAERQQMRRCIRFLKRWRCKQFANGGPVSIALTCAAYHWFYPVLEIVPGQDAQKPNDQVALKNLVTSILAYKMNERIVINLPVYPQADLLEKMTDLQMESFIQKLEKLEDALQESIDLSCPHEAAKKLQKQFGEDFDVPPKEDTAEKSKGLIVTTGASA